MATVMELDLWRRKQAALLYHFASNTYLRGLRDRIDELVELVDSLLALAERQRRDELLGDKKWGMRDTSKNWANCAWPFLADFLKDTNRDMSQRAFQVYARTGFSQFERGSSEYSMMWATPDEEKQVKELMHSIGSYAMYIDATMKRAALTSWDDFGMALAWTRHRQLFPQLPRLRVRTDIEGESGKKPPRTGVYVAQDDPNASVQFAWTGGAEGRLLASSTFNEVGLDALNAVGRQDLWFNEQKMFAFAMSDRYKKLFEKRISQFGNPDAELAPSVVSYQCFRPRPCKWYFVEMIDGETEEYDDIAIPNKKGEQIRVKAGETCPKDGHYATPASDRSRRFFRAGEIMPDIGNPGWVTIWQLTE